MADSVTGISFRYAGFWLRLVAMVIDSGIILLIMWIIGLIFGVNVGSIDPTQAELDSIRLLEAASLFVGWIYYAAMESTAPQATVGKLILGIYVTDLNGNRISFGRASLRYWAKLISSFILLIGYVMAAFTRQKQALHDIIASCLVLKR